MTTERMTEVKAEITDTYLALTDGRYAQRVPLHQIRDCNPLWISRDEMDAALLSLEQDGTAALYRMDDPLEITKDVKRGVRYSNGNPALARHIMYLSQ